MTDPEASSDAIAKLSRALGLDESRVRSAFKAAGVTPEDIFKLILHGENEEKVAQLAKELKVSRARLALALLDGAVQGASAWASQSTLGERVADKANRAADRAKEWAFDVVEFLFETFAETIPRFLNRVTLVLVLFGLVFAGMGVLALVSPELFLQVVVYVIGALLVVLGATSIWIAWKIHEATATLRTLARLARKWRSRWQGWSGRDHESRP